VNEEIAGMFGPWGNRRQHLMYAALETGPKTGEKRDQRVNGPENQNAVFNRFLTK
jgi:hypothetical protein